MRQRKETVDAFEGEDLSRRPTSRFWREVDKQVVKLTRKVERRRKPIRERKSQQVEMFGERDETT